MNKMKIFSRMVLAGLLGISAFTSCTKEPDESNLYTFTGKTIQDFLTDNDSIFNKFNIIMKRSGYDRAMSSYGQYTCYAPTNDGVDRYLDSLYNDTEAKEEHNGMTENSVYGLTDEQCKDIARYHLSSMHYSFIEDLSNANGKDITTMLNITFFSRLFDDGTVRLNNIAKVISYDNEMTNGFVHIIDNVIPLTNNRLPETLEKLPEYSIFYEALVKTGLVDSLYAVEKTNPDGTPKKYSLANNHGRPGSSFASASYYVPAECKIKFTIFAEDNETMAKYGITDFETLKEKCVEWYAGAADWYQYPDKANNPISTGDDYTYTYNVVNMFMRYHILKGGMPMAKLLYTYNSSLSCWNYAFGGEPYDYYETFLPHTMLKIWQPLYQNTGSSTNVWINRYRANNTLTEEVGTFGSDENHPILREGCLISKTKSNIQSYNGYIHNINAPLIYDRVVPEGVLNERLRIDIATVLHELASNNIRFASIPEIGARNLSSNDGTMSRIPIDYFDNLVCYKKTTQMCWYTQGNWRSYQSESLSGFGENDFAFRLPPVPTGDYEIRTSFAPTDFGGFNQYYIGTSKDPSDMVPLGLPVNARFPQTDDERHSIGYLTHYEFDDYGVESDLVLRNHDFMRAPASFSRGERNVIKGRISHPSEMVAQPDASCRYEVGTDLIRRILGICHIEQDKEYWLRVQNLLKGYDRLGFSVDFIELVPLNVVNNMEYSEDWY